MSVVVGPFPAGCTRKQEEVGEGLVEWLRMLERRAPKQKSELKLITRAEEKETGSRGE